MLVLQFAVAFVRPAFGSPWRSTWDRFHFYAGRLLVLAGPLVCITGVGRYGELFGDNLAFLIWVIIAVTLLIWASAVTLQCRRANVPAREVPIRQTQVF